MSVFRFKQFEINQRKVAMKVGTDGVLLGAWGNCESAVKVLDIGTGTGVIAMMLAQRYPQIHIDAIEIEPDAYEEALSNIANSKFRNRIAVLHSSLDEWIKFSNKQYDVIVCNPPFFSNGFAVADEKRKIARVAESLPAAHLLKSFFKLAQGGKMNLILPVTAAGKFIAEALRQNCYCCRKTLILSKPGRDPIRYLLEFSGTDCEVKEDTLTIENEGLNSFTEEYRQLTKDFYLNF